MDRHEATEHEGFTIADGTIVAIDLLADPARLRQLDLAVLNDLGPVDRNLS